MDSFSKYLEIGIKNVSRDLLNDINKQKCLNLAERMPELFAHFLSGYEKRLLDDNGEMDFFISAHNNLNIPNNFKSVFNFPAIIDYANRNDSWRRLKEFASAWSSQYSNVKDINMISLEFDFNTLGDDIIIPSVFFGLEFLPFWKSPDHVNELFERTNVFINGIEMLTYKAIDPGVKELIIEITKKSVDKFYIFQAGLMLSRDDAPVRICLRSFGVKGLMEAVTEFFPGSRTITEMDSILQNYGKLFDSIALDLDVTSSGIKKAGIECYFNRNLQPHSEKRWAQVFDLLCRDGYCKKEISDKLLDFNLKYMLNKDNVPAGLENVPNFYAQGLHHIKFTTGVDKKSFAKAYLWSGFNWS